MFGAYFLEWNAKNLLIRILVAMVLGIAIGLDRGVKKRGGGARTTMVVCLGATLVMMTEQFLLQFFPGTTDITRLAAQVISGVGFLGVGMIFMSGHQIRGLTSAASIWTCACVGLAAGIGFIDGAVIVTLIMILGIRFIPRLEQRIYKISRYSALYIEVENGKTITALLHKIKEDGCEVDSFEVDKPKAKGQYYVIMTTFATPRSIKADEYMEELREIKGVVLVDEM